MVSITSKSSTSRTAAAVGRVILPKKAYDLLVAEGGGRRSPKGDVLTVAQLAGIMAGKKTGELIPLCHPINLTNVQVELQLQTSAMAKGDVGGASYWIDVKALTECQGSTGVEMEALVAVSIACTTVWDMLKAVAGKEMVIEGIKVISKSGGKSGDWVRND